MATKLGVVSTTFMVNIEACTRSIVQFISCNKFVSQKPKNTSTYLFTSDKRDDDDEDRAKSDMLISATKAKAVC
jgi:hypothetical protein